MPVRILLAAAIVLMSGILAAKTNAVDSGDWDRLAGHALNGTVWTGDGEPSSWQRLVEVSASRQFVLIGENHDNAAHHQLQANLIGALVARDRKPAVVFEMIPTEEQEALDTYLANEGATAEGLGNAVGWEARGWPAWETYLPIADMAMDNRLMMVAGGLGRESAMKLARGGSNALSAEEQSKLALGIDFPDPLKESLLEELRIGHCDLLPLEALHPMVAVQRARDGVMAHTLLSAGPNGAVLIGGKGHTRLDRAIPYVLKQLDQSLADSDIVSIGMVGVQPDANSFTDYLEAEDGLPFDFVVFTERTEPIDHCERLRERFSNQMHRQNRPESPSD